MRALRSLLAAVLYYPRMRSLLDAGNRLRDRGNYPEALAYYRKARALNPEDPAPVIYEASAFNLMDRYAEALRCCDEAERLHAKTRLLTFAYGGQTPLAAFLWEFRGIALSDTGRPEEAISCYAKAIAISPGFALAWFNKAVAETRLGRVNDALSSVETACEIDPTYERAKGLRQRLARNAP